MDNPAKQLAAIRQTVQTLARQVGLTVGPTNRYEITTENYGTRLSTAKAWKRANDLMDATFHNSIFTNAAWNIMLEIYINQREGRALAVTSACVAANAPSTTALRYITNMQERGWVVKTTQHDDRRIHNLRLTDEGFNLMNSLLENIIKTNKLHGIGYLSAVN